MARVAREHSESGIYHVMLRGVNKQPLFEDDDDRKKFVSVLKECKEIGKFELFAYCLMDNHVHILIRPSDFEPLSTVFRRLGSRYVRWFNTKYGRVGHLFQDRYASEVVGDDTYFLSCLRYVLQNPVAAGLCETPFDYEYSSACEYIGQMVGITDTDLGLQMIGHDQFEEFACCASEDEHLDMRDMHRPNDREIRKVMKRSCGCETASDFQCLDERRRDKALVQMRRAGGSIRQISRITGVGTGVVRRVSAQR